MGEILVRILVKGEEAIVEEFLLTRLDYSMILFNNIQARGLSYRGQRYEGIYLAHLMDRIWLAWSITIGTTISFFRHQLTWRPS